MERLGRDAHGRRRARKRDDDGRRGRPIERLTQRDLTALLNAVRESYELRDLHTFAAHVLRAVPSLVGCDHRSYNEIDVSKRRASFLTDPVLDLPDGVSIFNRHLADHPLIAYHTATRDGRPVKFSDFLSRARLHRLGLYGEFFRPIRVEHQIAFTLPTPASRIVGIALSRSRPDFSERDRTLLQLLRPHLARAYENAAAVSAVERQLALVREGVDALGAGIVWIEPGGRVSVATRAARRQLDEYFGPSRGPRLPDALGRWVREQESCPRDVPAPRAPLLVEREGKQLIIRLISDPAGGLLLVEERRASLDAEVLERWGLTRREAEIMTWVAQGKTDAAMATILGISPRTVAKHLEHIFEKLGVETRTAAAARAHEMMTAGETARSSG